MTTLTTTTRARAEMTPTDVAVFGTEARRHPITDMVIEVGHGAKGVHAQALDHLQVIAREQGIEAARAVKARLEALTEADKADIHRAVVTTRRDPPIKENS
jgi:hypothetical protein